MSREEIRNLIGGYATGNLTEAERAALFAAVLEDQELFDALAREQPLAELLEDKAARGRLLAALGGGESPRRGRLWGGIRRPAVAALAASAAVAVLALMVFVRRGEQREEAKPVQVAEARKEGAPAPAAPAPTRQPAPQPKPVKPKPQKPRREDVREEPRVLQEAQATAEAAPAPAADAAAGAAFRPGRPVVARSSFRAESGLVRATVVRATPDGGYEPLAGDGAAIGDALRLRVEAVQTGYLSVFQREGQAGWRPVFNGKVEAGRTYFVPPEGSLRVERTGTKEFMLSLTGPAGQASERVVLNVK